MCFLAAAPQAPAAEIEWAQVDGRVTQADGTGLERACVQLTKGDWNVASDTTDSNGHYRVSGPVHPDATGPWRMRFENCSGYGNVLTEYYDDRLSAATADPVPLVGGRGNINAQLDHPGGVITGHVSGPEGEDLDEICVEPRPLTGSLTNEGITGGETDGAGNYVLAGLPSGDYKILFTDCKPDPSGDRNLLPEYHGGSRAESGAAVVSVTAGAATTGIGAELDHGGIIEGTVLDHTGTPLNRACINLFDADDDSFIAGRFFSDATAFAGPNGEYRIAALPGGDYKVLFFDCWFGDEPATDLAELFNDTECPGPIDVGSRSFSRIRCGTDESHAAADPIHVTEGAAQSGVDATLDLGGTISGRVTTPAGAPLVGACVEVRNADHPGWSLVRAAARTGPDGRYSIGALSTGEYAVHVFECSAGPPAFRDQWYSGGESLAAADRVAVTAGSESSGIDVEMNEGSVISGRVTGPGGGPVKGICVTVKFEAGGAAVWARTDADGRYRANRLDSGRYRVRFEDCRSPGTLGVEYWEDSPYEVTATVIDLPQDTELPGIDAQLVPGFGSITGTVEGPAGGALPFACVEAFDARTGRLMYDDFANQRHATGPGGGYVIDHLPGGRYKVLFHESCDDPNTPERNLLAEYYEGARCHEVDATRDGKAFRCYDRGAWNRAAVVTVNADTITEGIDARLERGGRMAGWVRGVGGRPLTGVCAALLDLDAPRFLRTGPNFSAPGGFPGLQDHVEVNAKGRYVINSVPGGLYKVLFEPCGSGGKGYREEYYGGAFVWSKARKVAVFAGSTTRPVGARLERRRSQTVRSG